MSNSVVDRDGAEQVKFGEYVVDFADNLKMLCNRTKGHINDARDNIKDNAPSAAMDKIEELMNEILASLPGTTDFGEKQIKQGKILIDAEAYTFKKF